METLKHEKECIRHMAIYKARVTKFKKRYPNYCKQCEASGLHEYHDYEGFLDTCDCPGCLEKGLCPRCMTPTIVTKKQTLIPASIDRLALVHEWEQCSSCGWRGDDDYGDNYCLPFAFYGECICKHIRSERERNI